MATNTVIPTNSPLSGSVLTSNGTSAPYWGPVNIADSSIYTTVNNTGNGAALHIKGDAEFEGNVKIQGRDLTEILSAIESRLAILTPNTALESEYEELKALGDAYRAAEKRFLEQKRIFDILKKQQ